MGWIPAMKKKILSLVFCLFLSSVTSCEVAAPDQPSISGNSTSENSVTATLPLTAYPTFIPTDTLVPFPTFTPPGPTPFPLYPVDNIQIVYLLDGNLYVQRSKREAVKLISSERGISALYLSDDGEKIVFWSQMEDSTHQVGLFSINTDGNQEQLLLSKEWLDSRGINTPFSVDFISGTHKFFISTGPCQGGDVDNCMINLSIVDADTGKIRQFLNPYLPGTLEFTISPNGQMVAVASKGDITIHNIGGNIIYPNIMNYTVSTPSELYPMIEWLSDSSGVVAALPKNVHAGWAFPYYFAYEIWSYKLGGQASLIPLDGQQPFWTMTGCGGAISVSPDGALLLYSQDTELFIGHLLDGHTQLAGMSGCWDGYKNWSPGSNYFLYRNTASNQDGSIISIHGSSFVAPWAGLVGQWIDKNHYLVFVPSVFGFQDTDKFVIGEVIDGVVNIYEADISLPEKVDVFDFVVLH
jgi:hypothetical protein